MASSSLGLAGGQLLGVGIRCPCPKQARFRVGLRLSVLGKGGLAGPNCPPDKWTYRSVGASEGSSGRLDHLWGDRS